MPSVGLKRWRTRLRHPGVIAVAAALVIAAVTIWMSRALAGDEGLAQRASLSASSIADGFGLDGLVGRGSGPWQAADQTVGAWVELSWSRAYTLRRVMIERDDLRVAGVLAGYLSFSDGSRVQARLSTSGPKTGIAFTPRAVRSLRFTVSEVSKGAGPARLRRIQVYDTEDASDVAASEAGNLAADARVTTSNAAAASSLRTLVDGDRARGPGRRWSTAQPGDAWVRLSWDQPRELTSIAITGARSAARLRSATIEFSDRSAVLLGAVEPDADRPTVVSFMPVSATWVRITFTSVSAGALTLGDIGVYGPSAPPVTPGGAAEQPAPPPAVRCAPDAGRPAGSSVALVVQCPQNGATVDAKPVMRVLLDPAFSSVTATPLAGDQGMPPAASVTATPNARGVAEVPLDVGAFAPGPFTVRLQANGTASNAKPVYAQLVRSGSPMAGAGPGRGPARGRSLVFRDEFTKAVSISRSGAGTDYVAGKPTVTATEDFGDAIFADPAAGLDTVEVVDGQYLHLAVRPKPADLPDPGGYNRSYVSGMLASARSGGSGFSARFGYFEARMLTPALPGTWPSFWVLPSRNLIAPRAVVAEFDAVEQYGQFPRGTCHSTHEHRRGTDGGIAHCSEDRWASDADAVAWHVYGLDVSPTRIRFYIDGRLVASAPQVRGGADPMFVLADLALGGGWPVDLRSVAGRADMWLDYIRVYV